MCTVDCAACHDRRMPIFCLITMYVQKGHIYHRLVQPRYCAQDTTILPIQLLCESGDCGCWYST